MVLKTFEIKLSIHESKNAFLIVSDIVNLKTNETKNNTCGLIELKKKQYKVGL